MNDNDSIEAVPGVSALSARPPNGARVVHSTRAPLELMINIREVVEGLLDSDFPVEQRIDMALVADEFDAPEVRVALEQVVRRKDDPILTYACAALARLWVRAGSIDRDLYTSLSYEARQAMQGVLLARAESL